MTQGYILHIPESRKALFEEYFISNRIFGEPVPSFFYDRNYPFLVFISAEFGYITHIAAGKGGQTAGSGMKRLNLEKAILLDPFISYLRIDKVCDGADKETISKLLKQGGIVPSKILHSLIAVLVKIDPTLESILPNYLVKQESVKRFSSRELTSIGNQKEAVSTALHLSEIDRTPLQSWEENKSTTQRSFLDGLGEAYLREDLMIMNDVSYMPGMELIRPFKVSHAQFKDGEVTLDVMIANRMRLEEQTGTDLIYYNTRYKSFVMVQYKAMEKETGTGPTFRLPDQQLDKEISAMKELLKHLEPAQILYRDDFRLNYSPFFIKLCPREIFRPDNIKLTPGMYFNLEHWDCVKADGDLLGRFGGRLINYDNIGRHITNTDFAFLVKHAWIGTTPNQSDFLEKIIVETMEKGKSIVYAVKREKEYEYNRYKNETSNDNDDIPF